IEGSTSTSSTIRRGWRRNLPEVVIYDFRHTRITRWAKVLPLPVVQRLAGHTSIATTMRHVHISDDDVVPAMTKQPEARKRQGEGGRRHKRGAQRRGRPERLEISRAKCLEIK